MASAFHSTFGREGDATTLEALSALLPAIQAAKAGGVDVTKVREAYTARRKELA